jgi:hypothetical protein
MTSLAMLSSGRFCGPQELAPLARIRWKPDHAIVSVRKCLVTKDGKKARESWERLDRLEILELNRFNFWDAWRTRKVSS